MPSLPTSLLIVLLAVLWIWVLVPMASRSREAVPESDDGAIGFRVLRRGTRIRRKRASQQDEDEALVEQLVDEADDDDEDLLEDEVDSWAADERELPPRRVVVQSSRPARRSGRGGFDPEQAAATAAYKYRRRRFITLLLLTLALGSAAVGFLLDPIGYWVAGGTGLLLLGFLGYLSRTVRIERAIEARRRARLQRNRELRPNLGRVAEPVSPYEQRARMPHQATEGRRLERQAPVASERPRHTSHVPPSMRQRYAIVDLDDDDPAFDDLERHQPVAYRRAVGQ